MKRKFKQWKKFASVVADIQATILLFLVYTLFVLPIGILLQTFSKKTLLGKRIAAKKGSYWLRRSADNPTTSWARKQ